MLYEARFDRTGMTDYHILQPPHLLSSPLRGFFRTEKGSDFKHLRSLFPPQWKTWLMGGVLRDLLLEAIRKAEVEPADIDLVISGAPSIDVVRKRLGNMRNSSNSFGGIKCQFRPKSMIFDLWRMEDHPNMSTASEPHTIEQLLRHNLLDVEAIAWDPETDVLHDCGCIKAIKEGTIGLMGPEGICQRFMAAQAAHAISIAFKTQFKIRDDVRAFIATALDECGRDKILEILERKLPHLSGELEVLCKDLLQRGVYACPAPTRTAHKKKSSSLLNTRP